MYNNLMNGEAIICNLFGRDWSVKVFGSEDAPLKKEELEELNWLIESKITDSFTNEILDYCNQIRIKKGKDKINNLLEEIEISAICIIKHEEYKSFFKKYEARNEIAWLGDCKSEKGSSLVKFSGDGIAIQFKDRKFNKVGRCTEFI